MMRDGEVDAVVAWKEDRLYRGFGVVPFFEALQTLPNARDFRVHLLHGHWDYSNFLIMAGIAQKELEDFRLRSMEGKRREVANGRVIVFNRPPFGYRAVVTRTDRGRITDSQLEVVEDQAETVRRIFSEFVAGANMEAIAVGLTNDGVPSYADQHAHVGKRTHGHGIWGRTSVRNILTRRRTLAGGTMERPGRSRYRTGRNACHALATSGSR